MTQEFFQRLWESYVAIAPRASTAYNVIDPEHKQLDHVAFRTFDQGPVTIKTLEPWLLNNGFFQTGEYDFQEKKVRAKSYSSLTNFVPRIFLSELKVSEQEQDVQDIIKNLIEFSCLNSTFPWCTVPWSRINERDYNILLTKAGDYASWVATCGLLPNHLTSHVSSRIASVVDTLESKGFIISSAGGKIKGGPNLLLEQGSTIADSMTYEGRDGTFDVPSAYLEFAHRWIDPDTNKLFDKFVETSANKIFESTDRRKHEFALAIVKPDAMKRGLSNNILSALVDNDIEIVEVIRRKLTKYEAEFLYQAHETKEFFSRLVDFMTSGESMLIKVRGVDCSTTLRKVVDKMRKSYAMSTRENVIHGSDSVESGQREVRLFDLIKLRS